MTEIGFEIFERFEGWQAAPVAVRRMMQDRQVRRVLEVGSGANPTLSPAEVAALGVEYCVNDQSAEELEKADASYERLVMDVSGESPGPAALGRFDFIFSRMVNEHVADGERYYANLHQMLMPGGWTVHWFSTLYALPFLANRWMPEWLGETLLRAFQPRDPHRQGKFKAYYSWSRGPSSGMIRRFERLGFEVARYVGYFGHSYYARRLPWVHALEMKKARWLVRHPVPCCTSYAMVVLRKPAGR